MNEPQAKVTSIDALEVFRSRLIVYLEKAGRVLDEVNDDVTRTRAWLETDQRRYWEDQVRRRARVFEQRKQEMFGVPVAELMQATAAAREAKRVLAEAEAKLALVKQWRRQYENRVAPLAKEVDKLRDVLGQDMRRGVHFLTQAVKSLDAYTQLQSHGSAPATPAPTSEPPPEDGGKGEA